jgi:hypothetical protein
MTKLFNIVKDKGDPDGQTVTVEPTEYLTKLKPDEVIGVLQTYVKELAEEVDQCSKEILQKPENQEKLPKMVFELEVAQKYLAQVFEEWKANK